MNIRCVPHLSRLPLHSVTSLLLCLGPLGMHTVRAEDAKPIVAPSEIAPGPFKPELESFKQYRYPEWFRDAKFGIWSHWGPQAVPRRGDWYARDLYYGPGKIDPKTGRPSTPAKPAYGFHQSKYGHPSKFGYKDVIPLWKAERWDPDKLMALYRRVGARYFVSMGSHHDNFFLWNSKIHRWNSVAMGPKKDVVGLWQKAAKAQGLRFGVSEHLGASFTWFQHSHGADADGPMAGVPYDGNDPQYEDLYHAKAAPDDKGWLTNNPAWHRRWFEAVKELIDLYQPDLVYSDSQLPFGKVGHSMLAHYYNQDLAKNGGDLQAVYTCKKVASEGRWVDDVERGVAPGISPYPWQTDSSIGDWYYREGQKYKSAQDVIQMLVDIVSKNGNLLINVVQTPEGDLDPDILQILEGIASWTAANGEGIYGSRPWKVYGEGPSTTEPQEKGHFGGIAETRTKPYTAEDIRFTTSKDGKHLYAFCMGKPEGDIRIVSLGKASKLANGSIDSVQLLGSSERLSWSQEPDALVIKKPGTLPAEFAVGIKIVWSKQD